MYNFGILYGQCLFGFISRTMVDDYNFQIVVVAGFAVLTFFIDK